MTTAAPNSDASNVSTGLHWDEVALHDRCLGNLKLIRQVLQKFLATMDHEITEMRRVWGAGEIDKLAANAHRFKGTAATVGAVQLEAINREIELQARSGQCGELEAQFTQLAAEQRYLFELFTNYNNNSSSP